MLYVTRTVSYSIKRVKEKVERRFTTLHYQFYHFVHGFFLPILELHAFSNLFLHSLIKIHFYRIKFNITILL